jgi:hypothetical protein
MRSITCHDGIRIGEPGSEISRLVGLGFLEIGPGANGHDAAAKLTPAVISARSAYAYVGLDGPKGCAGVYEI